ncbi:MAG: hypothetical protein RI894_1508 [Bacteroidota bacterium]|jgi:hypothetical protein
MKPIVFKAVLGLKSQSTPHLLQRATLIHGSIAANVAIFATPDPAPTVIKAKIDALQSTSDKIVALEQQLAIARDTEGNQAQALKHELQNTGAYVEKLAKAANDPSIILKAGFEQQSEAVKTTAIGVPQFVVLQEVPQTTGALSVRIKVVTNAKGYAVRYCTDPAQADWREAQYFSSSSGMNLKAASGTRVYVQVKAFGPNNIESDWSDIAARVVP